MIKKYKYQLNDVNNELGFPLRQRLKPYIRIDSLLAQTPLDTKPSSRKINTYSRKILLSCPRSYIMFDFLFARVLSVFCCHFSDRCEIF